MIPKEVERLLKKYAEDIRSAMPDSVSKLIVEEYRDNGAGVLAPFWLPVLEKGRGPRKSSTDAGLYLKIYKWMGKKGLFKSKTNRGKMNEAKALTWYINKYGTKLYRDRGFKEVYSRKTREVIDKIGKEYSGAIGRITSDILQL